MTKVRIVHRDPYPHEFLVGEIDLVLHNYRDHQDMSAEAALERIYELMKADGALSWTLDK